MENKDNYTKVTNELLNNIVEYKNDINEEMKRGKETIYSVVTADILGRVNTYRNNIKNDFVIDAYEILKGITIFEEILKEINPDVINDEVVNNVIRISNKYINNLEYHNQMTLNGIRIGLEHSLMIMSIYNSIKNKDKKLIK